MTKINQVLIKKEKTAMVPKIKKLFSHFWEWNQVDNLIFRLEIILEGIKNDKKLWNKDLLNELEISAEIMINNQENVHGEDEMAMFLEEWFETIGEVFIKTKPIVNEKREFIRKICGLIEKDNYGLDTSFEKSLVAICKTKQDLELIKEIVKPLELEHPKRQGHYGWFYDELDKKIHKLK